MKNMPLKSQLIKVRAVEGDQLVATISDSNTRLHVKVQCASLWQARISSQHSQPLIKIRHKKKALRKMYS